MPIQSYSTTVNFVSNVAKKGINLYTISLFSCSKKLINKFSLLGRFYESSYITPISGVNLTGALLSKFEDIQLNSELNIGLIELDSLFYPPTLNSSTIERSKFINLYVNYNLTSFSVILC